MEIFVITVKTLFANMVDINYFVINILLSNLRKKPKSAHLLQYSHIVALEIHCFNDLGQL